MKLLLPVRGSTQVRNNVVALLPQSSLLSIYL